MSNAQERKISLADARIDAGMSQSDLVQYVNDEYRGFYGRNILSLSTLKAVEKDATRIHTRTANAIVAVLNKHRAKFNKSKVTIHMIDWRVQGLSPISQKKKDAIDNMRSALTSKTRKDKE